MLGFLPQDAPSFFLLLVSYSWLQSFRHAGSGPARGLWAELSCLGTCLGIYPTCDILSLQIVCPANAAMGSGFCQRSILNRQRHTALRHMVLGSRVAPCPHFH